VIDARKGTGEHLCSRCLKEVALYIDGSCWGNPGPGGWAAILVYKGTEREFFGSERQTTSSRMELRAAIEGLRCLKESCRVSVEGDSQYVVRAFNDDWLEGWQCRGWRKVDGEPVLNHDLWEELLAEVGKHEVRWTWVRGHAGNPYNERCHALAVRGCKAAIPGGWGPPACHQAPKFGRLESRAGCGHADAQRGREAADLSRARLQRRAPCAHVSAG
jgi:ribonuclease HI